MFNLKNNESSRRTGMVMLIIFSVFLNLFLNSPVFVTASYAFEGDYVPMTRWVHPYGMKPMTYEEWKRIEPAHKNFMFESKLSRTPVLGHDVITGKHIMILINENIYPDIESAISTYMDDISLQGFSSNSFAVSYGTPDELRNFLINLYNQGMSCCLLIGDFPVQWYKVEEEAFPIDFYYMDLDGEWLDLDKDGVLDTHQGETNADIFLGRLCASPLKFNNANEVDLLLNYFEKNHRYREGEFPLFRRGLMYVDDDWAIYAPSWNTALQSLYPVTTLVRDVNETNADDYRQRLVDNYEWIQVCAHSSSALHQFTVNTDLLKQT
jgi:hypothetical protein